MPEEIPSSEKSIKQIEKEQADKLLLIVKENKR
jgi:hypothetical protein